LVAAGTHERGVVGPDVEGVLDLEDLYVVGLGVGLGFRVQGLGSSVEDSGFAVLGVEV